MPTSATESKGRMKTGRVKEGIFHCLLMAIHTFTLLYFRCSHPITFKRDTCKDKLKYFFHCPTYKTFCWGSPGYQMCLQDVQTLTAVEHAQKIGFITFIHDKLHFTSCKLTEVSRAWSRVEDTDFESWIRIFHSPPFFHIFQKCWSPFQQLSNWMLQVSCTDSCNFTDALQHRVSTLIMF